jgi:hypothetical protein
MIQKKLPPVERVLREMWWDRVTSACEIKRQMQTAEQYGIGFLVFQQVTTNSGLPHTDL